MIRAAKFDLQTNCIALTTSLFSWIIDKKSFSFLELSEFCSYYGWTNANSIFILINYGADILVCLQINLKRLHIREYIFHFEDCFSLTQITLSQPHIDWRLPTLFPRNKMEWLFDLPKVYSLPSNNLLQKESKKSQKSLKILIRTIKTIATADI